MKALKVFLLVVLAVFSLNTFAVSTTAMQQSTPNLILNVLQNQNSVNPEEEYTYVYVWINGVLWVYVYDSGGGFIRSYPHTLD
jgi:hypothetical protein